MPRTHGSMHVSHDGERARIGRQRIPRMGSPFFPSTSAPLLRFALALLSSVPTHSLARSLTHSLTRKTTSSNPRHTRSQMFRHGGRRCDTIRHRPVSELLSSAARRGGCFAIAKLTGGDGRQGSCGPRPLLSGGALPA